MISFQFICFVISAQVRVTKLTLENLTDPVGTAHDIRITGLKEEYTRVELGDTISFTGRESICFDEGWKFHLGDAADAKKISITALPVFFPNRARQLKHPLRHHSGTVVGVPCNCRMTGLWNFPLYFQRMKMRKHTGTNLLAVCIRKTALAGTEKHLWPPERIPENDGRSALTVFTGIAKYG